MALSVLHQAPLLLLEARPELLLALLGRTLESGERLAPQHADITQTVPVERRADAVLTVQRDDVTVAAFVVEVQLEVDRDKRFAWPLYAAAVHARFRCPTSLVVIAPRRRVAAWARKPIPSFDAGDGRAWAPNVIGPEQIPRITSIDEAARSPELAVLSAAVHGRAPDGARVVHATLAAVAQLDEERRECYGNLLAVVLGDVARVAMEALMTLGKNPFEGAMERLFERHYRKLERQARTEERCVAIRKVLLMVLAERGLGPSEETRARVENGDGSRHVGALGPPGRDRHLRACRLRTDLS